jgi:hypothetical protein
MRSSIGLSRAGLRPDFSVNVISGAYTYWPSSNRKYFISKVVISRSAAGFAAGRGAVGAIDAAVLLHAAVNTIVLMATIIRMRLAST